VDSLTPEKRSSLMGRVRQRDTAPELAVRRLLHSMGYRYRLGRRDLPGSPDLVLPRHGKVIFVHGCFWHRHRGCKHTTTPKSNARFWVKKFAENVKRDRRVRRRLKILGWASLIVWSCQAEDESVLEPKLAKFLKAARRSPPP
jgi:DNA mismatch endonuclease (patch repair protein)